MTEAHTQRAHAKLAPSAAHRWMECPGSVRLSEGMPNESSVFAAEGTAAHELAAHCLETGDDPSTYLDMWVDIQAKDGASKFVNLDAEPTGESAMRFFRVDEEMADAVAMYTEHVRSLAPSWPYAGNDDYLVSVEQRLDMTHLHPAIFGTGDATVFDHAECHLHVCDFKYGKGVAVDADNNPQLLLYAAGAARRYHNQRIAKLTLHIIQPRAPHALGPIRTYDLDLLDLFEFEETLAKAAAETDKSDAKLNPGEWCRFCPAQPICPAARTAHLAAAAEEFGDIGEPVKLAAPEAMPPERLAGVLREADMIGNWVKSVQEFAHMQACNGNMPLGFKMVAKRAIRKWANEAAAKAHLYDMGATNDDILTEPKLKSPAQLEKLFPGKNAAARQAAMADLVVKQSSGTNLVPVEDPRPAVKADAASEFEVVE